MADPFTDGEGELQRAEHISPRKTGDNISAKRVATYVWNSTTSEWERMTQPGGTEYTEGDTDATITGTAMMWEDAGDTLKPVSASSPLPVTVKNSLTPNVDFDYIDIQQTSATVETYVYKQGGVSGTTVQTITVTYTDSTKNDLDKVEYS